MQFCLSAIFTFGGNIIRPMELAMKLPSWTPSVSTAMPRKSYTLQNTPAMVKPRVQDFYALDDPDDYTRLARAEAQSWESLSKTVTSVADVMVRLKVADDNIAVKAGSAEYRNNLASWIADRERRADEIDPQTGKPLWETYQEDFNRYADEQKSALRDKYEFTTNQAEAEWRINSEAADTRYRETLLTVGNKNRIERMEGRYITALADAKHPEGAEQLVNSAVESDVRSPAQGVQDLQAWRSSWAYETSLQLVNNSAATPQEMLDFQHSLVNNTGEAQNMTPTQRVALLKAVQGRVEGDYLQVLNQQFEAGGVAAAGRFVTEVAGQTHKDTHLINPESHADLVSKLGTQFRKLKSISDAMGVKQTSADLDNLLRRELSDSEVEAAYVTMDNKQQKRADALYGPAIAELSPDDFYNPAVRERYVPLQNMVRIGFIPDTAKRRIERDINSRAPGVALAAADMVRSIDVNSPHAAEDLSKDARAKAYFLVDANRNGRPLLSEDGKSGALVDWDTFRNQTPEQEKDLREQSTRLLVADPASDRIKRIAAERQVTDSDPVWRDVPADSPEFNQVFTHNLHYFYRVTQSEGAAEDAAMSATMQIFGATTRYGTSEPVWELSPPETVLNIPGHRAGAPSELIDNQFNAMLTEINMQREVANLSPLNKDQVRLELKTNSRDTWYVVTPTGEYVVDPIDGNRTAMQFDVVDREQAAVQKTTLHDDNAQQYVTRQTAVLADSGIPLVRPEGDRPQPGRTMSESVSINRDWWKTLPDKVKNTETSFYRAAFRQLREVNARYPVEGLNQADIDMQIHYYLTSLGYMQGDENGAYITPPGRI